jgi:hypothetical protein
MNILISRIIMLNKHRKMLKLQEMLKKNLKLDYQNLKLSLNQ